MVVRPRRSLPLFVLCALAVMPHALAAEPTLAEAVRQLDAKYLDAPDIEAADNAPKIEIGGGEEAGPPEVQEIAQGAVKAAVTFIESTDTEGNVIRDPVVTVFADGAEVAKLSNEGAGLSDPVLSVQIAELDASNAYPEVVVSFYTGGAHCCSNTSVVLSNQDGSAWSTLDIGEFDGGPLLAVDLDGDSRYEFETRDNAFLYTFACYACSEAPLQILSVADGAVKNVSTDARYRTVHAAYLRDMIGNVPEDDVNGFLAGYVGEKSLLGESGPAWELMLAYYDKDSDWGLESCDRELDDNGECPGQETKLTFPEALERLLNENGYTVED